MSLEPDALWQDLMSVALVGTERQSFQPLTAPGALGHLLSQLRQHSPETALLTTAATLSLYQQVGREAATKQGQPPQPCPKDLQVACPPAITHFLLRMLSGGHLLVLPEWLGLLAEAGQRIPNLYLPDLLDLGRQQTNLRPEIAKVLGERGRWLAQQNPDWNYAVQIASSVDWETGSAAARLLFLTELRGSETVQRTSQDPPHSLALLQASWKQEAAADRAKFLSTFRTGLSLADEPFLIQASCDRSKEVRRVATDLLASVPESSLCQRMAQRLRQWVQVSPAGDAWEIQLPDACDAAMQEDGIELKPQSGRGERTEWLRQIIGATPLGFWLELQPQGIPALMEMAQASEWQDLLLSGWQLALRRQCNKALPEHRDWAMALLKTVDAKSHEQLQGLLGVLNSADQQTAITPLFTAETDISADAPIWVALNVLVQHPPDWSESFSHQVLALIQRFITGGKNYDLWRMRDLFSRIPLRIPPELIPEVSQLRTIAELTPWNDIIHLLISTLQFRQDMKRAFAGNYL